MSQPFRHTARGLRDLSGPVFAVLLAVAAWLWAAPLRADGFVDGIEDLPLMPGLVAVPEASGSFEALVGRIVVAFAEGAVPMQDVRTFYDATLPQLGWRRLPNGHWARADEELSLDAVVERGGLVVRFELVPR